MSLASSIKFIYYTVYTANPEDPKKLIMWDVDSLDYENTLTAEDIANRVIDNVRSGSIVLMHDGGGDRSKTLAATQAIVKTLQSKGYAFKTVSELLKK